MNKIAVVSVAQTDYSEQLPLTERELVYDVSRCALTQAGVSIDELGTIVTSSSDYWQGMGCSNVFYYEGAAAYFKDSPKTEGDSVHAFAYACMRILSGHFDAALVTAVSKVSDTPGARTLSNLTCDPVQERWLGLEETAVAGLQASALLDRGVPEETAARIAARNLRNAVRNPHAHNRGDFSVAEILASPSVASPIRTLECAPDSDGACAVVIASDDLARKICEQPAWVLGIGWATESFDLGGRDLLKPIALEEASRRAYSMAGITRPRSEISIAELCSPHCYEEVLWYEGLGLAPEGEGWRLVDDGVTDLDGDMPVNPSGGVLGANAYVPRGLVRVGEAALQVMGKAGDRQVRGVERALAQSCYGFAGQAQAVVVLGKE